MEKRFEGFQTKFSEAWSNAACLGCQKKTRESVQPRPWSDILKLRLRNGSLFFVLF